MCVAKEQPCLPHKQSRSRLKFAHRQNSVITINKSKDSYKNKEQAKLNQISDRQDSVIKYKQLCANTMYIFRVIHCVL